MDYSDGPNPNIHKQEGFHKVHHLQPMLNIIFEEIFLKIYSKSTKTNSENLSTHT